MASGGYRQPQRPAATSGPGALSRRTDGGAGNAKQPIRVPTGGKYGEAKALRQQQQSAPMAAGPTGTPGGAGGAPAAGGIGPAGGAFGPTERPMEPNTAGMMQGSPATMDPDMAMRVLYSVFPHPNIERMIRKGGNPI